jgi:hypothetical protein
MLVIFSGDASFLDKVDKISPFFTERKTALSTCVFQRYLPEFM